MALDELLVIQDRASTSCLPSGYERLLNYGSGRPCVFGSKATASASSRASTRLGDILLVAECAASRRKFEAASGRLGSLAALEGLLPTLVGRLLVVVAQQDSCVIYPTIFPSVQVYWTNSACDVVASRLDVLAGLCRLSTDLGVLSGRLSTLGLPWPMSGSTIWQGVSRLTVGECLEVAPGRRSTRRWWSHPKGVLDRGTIVRQLRSSLVDTMADLCAEQNRVGVDVSGGLDSTAVAYLAAEAGASVDAHHVEPADGDNDDTRWAKRAILDTAARPMISTDRARTSFFISGDRDKPEADLAGPALWSAGRRHLRAVARIDKRRDVSLHLTGFGGDELFTPMPAQVWSLWHQSGLPAFPRVTRSALMNRVPVWKLVRAATNRTSITAELTRGPLVDADPTEMDLSWGVRLALPRWATPTAEEMVRDLAARSARRKPLPLSEDRARHQALSSLSYVRDLLNDITLRFSTGHHRWLSPFLEPGVFSVALQQASISRLDDGYRKLLLRDSLTGIVPAAYFDRGAKGEYSNELHIAMRHHHSAVASYFAECLLADLGLVDRSQLLKVIDSGAASTDDLHFIQSTLEAERWARAAHRP